MLNSPDVITLDRSEMCRAYSVHYLAAHVLLLGNLAIVTKAGGRF